MGSNPPATPPLPKCQLSFLPLPWRDDEITGAPTVADVATWAEDWEGNVSELIMGGGDATVHLDISILSFFLLMITYFISFYYFLGGRTEVEGMQHDFCTFKIGLEGIKRIHLFLLGMKHNIFWNWGGRQYDYQQELWESQGTKCDKGTSTRSLEWLCLTRSSSYYMYDHFRNL